MLFSTVTRKSRDALLKLNLLGQSMKGTSDPEEQALISKMGLVKSKSQLASALVSTQHLMLVLAKKSMALSVRDLRPSDHIGSSYYFSTKDRYCLLTKAREI